MFCKYSIDSQCKLFFVNDKFIGTDKNTHDKGGGHFVYL